MNFRVGYFLLCLVFLGSIQTNTLKGAGLPPPAPTQTAPATDPDTGLPLSTDLGLGLGLGLGALAVGGGYYYNNQQKQQGAEKPKSYTTAAPVTAMEAAPNKFAEAGHSAPERTWTSRLHVPFVAGLNDVRDSKLRLENSAASAPLVTSGKTSTVQADALKAFNTGLATYKKYNPLATGSKTQFLRGIGPVNKTMQKADYAKVTSLIASLDANITNLEAHHNALSDAIDAHALTIAQNKKTIAGHQAKIKESTAVIAPLQEKQTAGEKITTAEARALALHQATLKTARAAVATANAAVANSSKAKQSLSRDQTAIGTLGYNLHQKRAKLVDKANTIDAIVNKNAYKADTRLFRNEESVDEAVDEGVDATPAPKKSTQPRIAQIQRRNFTIKAS